MAGSFQTYLANAIPKAIEDLEAAFLRLPEDKRDWCPMGSARTALDQVAEVALMGDGMVELIKNRSFPADYSFEQFGQMKKNLADQGWDAIQKKLQEDTPKVVAAVLSIPDEDLTSEVQMPWGAMTMTQIAAYHYWNPIYHEGQINYLATMVGAF